MWVVTLLSGIANGLVRGAIRDLAHLLFDLRLDVMLKAVDATTPGTESASHIWIALPIDIGFACIYVLIAAVIVYFEPFTAGTGTSEVAASLNGIKTPRFFSFRTACLKFIATLFTSASGLIWVGPESSMSHLGGATNILIAKGYLWLRKRMIGLPDSTDKLSDRERVELVSTGLAMGTAAAFRTTLAGMTYVAEGIASLWRNEYIWRCFCGTFLAVYVARLVDDYFQCTEEIATFCVDATGFTNYPVTSSTSLTFLEYVAVLCTAVVSGILVALQTTAVELVGPWFMRSLAVKFKVRRISVALLLMVLVCVATIGLIAVTPCIPTPAGFNPGSTQLAGKVISPADALVAEHPVCPEGHHNPSGVILLSFHEVAIRYLYQAGLNVPYWVLLTLLLFVYLIGTPFVFAPLPVGFVTEYLLVGGLIGRFFGQALGCPSPEAVALCGSAAALAGYFRFPMTSIVFILQMSGAVRLLIPIIGSVLISTAAAYPISPSLLEAIIRLRHVPYLPFLHARVKNALKDLRIGDISGHTLEEVPHIAGTGAKYRRVHVDRADSGSQPSGSQTGSSRSEDSLVRQSRMVNGVYCVKENETVHVINACLDSNNHHAYPIIGEDLKVIGIIGRDKLNAVASGRPTGGTAAGDTVNIPVDASNAAFIVEADHTFLRCYRLFAKSGLRHMVVVDPSSKKLQGIITRADLVDTITSVSEPHYYYLTT